MREEIHVPAGLGAEVFVDEDGGVTIAQQQWEERVWVSFTPREAKEVAEALAEVAAAALEGQRQEMGATSKVESETQQSP